MRVDRHSGARAALSPCGMGGVNEYGILAALEPGATHRLCVSRLHPFTAATMARAEMITAPGVGRSLTLAVLIGVAGGGGTGSGGGGAGRYTAGEDAGRYAHLFDGRRGCRAVRAPRVSLADPCHPPNMATRAWAMPPATGPLRGPMPPSRPARTQAATVAR